MFFHERDFDVPYSGDEAVEYVALALRTTGRLTSVSPVEGTASGKTNYDGKPVSIDVRWRPHGDGTSVHVEAFCLIDTFDGQATANTVARFERVLRAATGSPEDVARANAVHSPRQYLILGLVFAVAWVAASLLLRYFQGQ